MIQSINKTFYQTTDGKEFDDALEAASHQAVLDEFTSIDAFTASVEAVDRNATRLRNTLFSYVAWKARQAA